MIIWYEWIRNTSRVEIVLPNEYIVNELKNVMCYDIFSIYIILGLM